MTKSTPKYIRLNDDLWQKLTKAAEKENRTISNLVETILLEWAYSDKYRKEKKKNA